MSANYDEELTPVSPNNRYSQERANDEYDKDG